MFHIEAGAHIWPWDPKPLFSEVEKLRLHQLRAEAPRRGSGLLTLRRPQFARWLIAQGRLSDELTDTDKR